MTAPLLNWVYPQRILEQRTEPAQRGIFSILIPVSLPRTGGPLVSIADMLVGPDRSLGRIYPLHLRPPIAHEAYRPDDVADLAEEQALGPLLAQAKARSIPVEPISFITTDVPADICSTAGAHHVDLVLMGFHKPVFGKAILGGAVHRVLATCPAHVGIFVDRAFRAADRILVPYLDGPHDHLALELAARMARNTSARVTVLSILPPLRGDAARTAQTKSAVHRIFNDPIAQRLVSLRFIEDTSPVSVVVHQAQQFDLVIIGVAEEWGLESHLFGWRPERIARDCPCSLLIVRRHQAAPAESPQPSQQNSALSTPITQTPPQRHPDEAAVP